MDTLKQHEEDMNSATGSAKKMFTEVYGESLQAKLTDLKRAFENLYEKILSSDTLKWLITEATEFINALSNIDAGTVKIIATFTALGLSLKAIGTFTTALKGVESIASLGKNAGLIGSLAGGFTRLGTSIGGLTTASLGFIATPLGLTLAGLSLIIGGSIATYEAYKSMMSRPLDTPTEELSAFEQTINSFTGDVYKSRKELQETGLIYKDFGDDISDSFKDGVEKATDSYHEFEMALTKSNIDDKTTSENAKAIKGMVNNIVDEAKSAVMARKSEVQKEMSKLFTAGDGKVDTSEQSILDGLTQGYNDKFDAIQTINQKIYDTWNKAIQDHGKLSEEDIALIKQYVQQVQQIEMEAKANNESEQNFAKNQFIERLSGMSASDASEVYQKAKKDLDENNADARASYDTGLQDLKKYHDELLKEKEKALQDGDEVKAKEKQSIADETQTQIDAKQNEYQKLIEKQRALQKEYLEELYKKNPNLKGKINEIDGSELKGEDLDAQANVKKVTEQFDEIAKATETGIKHVQDESGKWHDVYTVVDKNTGLITATYDSLTGETGGYTKELEKQADDFATKYEAGLKKIQDALTGTHMGFGKIDSDNQLLDNAGNILTTLENVKTKVDGTKEAIMSLNGQEIVIKTDANGTITNLDEIYTKLGMLPEGKTVHINAETGAVEMINKVEDKLDEVDGKTGTVKVNETGAEESTQAVNETGVKVDETDGKSATVTVTANTSQAMSAIQSVLSKLGAIAGRTFSAVVNVTKNVAEVGIDKKAEIEASNGDNTPHHATGTSNFKGEKSNQWTWINEGNKGELVTLPDGTQIIPHDLSEKMMEEKAKNSGGSLTVNNVDIYQGKQNTNDVLDVNKANTLNKAYEAEPDKDNMSDEEKKAKEEEEKKLKDRVDKEKQYLDDISSAWDSNSKAVTQSIKSIELTEEELGDDITSDKKIDLLNQKYQLQVSLLDEAKKQLNTYKSTTLDTSEGQEELGKKVQEATDTLLEQKEAVVDAYNEIKKYREELKKANIEAINSTGDKIVEGLKQEYESDKTSKLSKLKKAYEDDVDDIEDKIDELQEKLDELNSDDSDNEAKLSKLKAEKQLWLKDNSTESTKHIQDLNTQISDLEKTIQKNSIQSQIDELNKKKSNRESDYEDEKQEVEDKYNGLLDEHKLYNEAEELLTSKNLNRIKELLSKQDESFKQIGTKLGSALTDPIQAEIDKTLKAIDDLKQSVGINSDNTSSDGNTKKSNSNSSSSGMSKVWISDGASTQIYTDATGTETKGSLWSNGIASADQLQTDYEYNNGFYKIYDKNGNALGWVDRTQVNEWNDVASASSGGRTPSNIGDDGAVMKLHKDEMIANATDTLKFDEMYNYIKNSGGLITQFAQTYGNTGQFITPTVGSDLSNLTSGIVNNNTSNTKQGDVTMYQTFTFGSVTDSKTKSIGTDIATQIKQELRTLGKIK